MELTHFVLRIVNNASGHSGEVIPVPIPNTEVKLSYVDDTALQRESRKLPAFFLSFIHNHANSYCLIDFTDFPASAGLYLVHMTRRINPARSPFQGKS